MTAPALTLITITKDDADGLARTLDSAAAFRAAGGEHLVVDGSETERVGELDTRLPGGIRVVQRLPRGIADAFNAGVAVARSEWLWFLNSGDRVDPRLTPAFLGELLARSAADVVIGGTTYAGEAEPRAHPPAHLRWPPFRSWIPHPSTLVRRRLFAQFGPFDERYTIAMDYEWWLRTIPRGAAVDVLSVPFAVFAPGGISQRPENSGTIRREQRAAVRKHQGALVRAWAALAARWWKAWVVAQFAGRRRNSSIKR